MAEFGPPFRVLAGQLCILSSHGAQDSASCCDADSGSAARRHCGACYFCSLLLSSLPR